MFQAMLQIVTMELIFPNPDDATASSNYDTIVGPDEHCYNIQDWSNWAHANESCTAIWSGYHNGFLASIHSKEANDFLGKILRDLHTDNEKVKRFWIGGYLTDRLHWADGSAFDYSNWAPGKRTATTFNSSAITKQICLLLKPMISQMRF